ncbi:MAG TPA: amylo-alpha-1,6-glucosidase [Symbiobacteriaceae bacterium]|nr:amylo-alpha-1,6-glucosidase [Symbiobacteriaceae bacterium]
MDQLVTREGDLFQVSDRRGDFVPEQLACGLFYHDTRFLSRLELRVDGAKPELLSSSAAENYVQRVFGQARVDSEALFRKTNLAVQRQRVIYGGAMYERITLTNYELEALQTTVDLSFDADFVDLFEVRGAARARRGEQLPAELGKDWVILGYRGLDAIVRQTEVIFTVTPAALTAQSARWELQIPSHGKFVLDLIVRPAENGKRPGLMGFDAALMALKAEYGAWSARCAAIESDSETLNRVLERSVKDLRILLADYGKGPFPVAGIPWYAVPFGRDSILTALEALPLTPSLARGTLRTLAAWQGTEQNDWRQEAPGKIAHELRFGEMANLDEIPFKRYYGTVDATPLFLVLLCEYYAWTGDLGLVRELLPNIKAALGWIGEGFLEFRADQGMGLVVQSWKDSPNSMTHRDGRPAASPVAVSEVQGYVYDAKRRLAPILAELGEAELAQRLQTEAEELKQRFGAAFWMEDRQYHAIALDGAGRQVGTVSSDIGHCLWSGIIDAEKAPAVAAGLTGPGLFSGWGIRTLAADESSYNPLSYHNGSVWPHDTALCVLGLKRSGFDAEANRVLGALVDAAAHFPDHRLPELFCGYARQDGAPVDYPVACSPQAWAAAAPFALIQAILGLEPDAPNATLRVRPALPAGLGRLTVRGLRVGGAVVDLTVTASGVQADVREGNLRVVQAGAVL